MIYIDPDRFVYAEADDFNIDFDNNLTNFYNRKNDTFTTFENSDIHKYYPWFTPEMKINYRLDIKIWQKCVSIAKEVKENKAKLD